MQRKTQPAKDLKGTIDVGIVTMRKDEAQAVLARLAFDSDAEGLRTYGVATLPIDGGLPLKVAHIRCRDQGPDEAEATTRALIQDLAPRWIVLVGIAGTVPNEDVCLGDVAISSLVYDMRLSVNKPGGKRGYAVRPANLHDAARDVVAHLSDIELRLGPWHAALPPRPAVPIDASKIAGDADWHAKVAATLRFHFGAAPGRPPHPVMHTVPFVSGSELTKDPAAVHTWLQAARDAKAIEMEIVGALKACVQQYEGNDVPLLSVRGISDMVGFEREPVWTQYACDSAAAFLVAWLESGAFHGGPPGLAPVAAMVAVPAPAAPGGPPPDNEPRALLRLGSLSLTPKSVSNTSMRPMPLFLKLANDARGGKGRRRIVVGWNVRPVQDLGVIQFAYLQQLSRLAQWGFKIKICIYDVCTTENYSPVQLGALLDGFERQLLRFRNLGRTTLTRVSRLLQRRTAAEVTQELFRLGRLSLGQTNNSANDPATSLDNLLCMAVESWEKYDLLVAGGRDANDFWAQYRTRLSETGVVRDGLSLMLDFPKLLFGAVSTPERLVAIPHTGDSVEQIEAKLRSIEPLHYDGIWNALLAPCGHYPRPPRWDEARLAADIHHCFRHSPFLTASDRVHPAA